MNIVTAYPTHMPITPVNPFTEQARRDNAAKELIGQAEEAAAAAAEKGAGSDAERAKKAADQQNQAFQTNDKNDNEFADAIEGQEQRQSSDQQQSEQEQQQAFQEQREVAELSQRDAEVRAHEQAHANAGGQYTGSPNYEFETGPDGKRYAVEGHVDIDISKVADDPQATIEKMETVRAAALAPAEPSSQDLSVAAEASRIQADARAELAQQNRSEIQGEDEDSPEGFASISTSAEDKANGIDVSAVNQDENILKRIDVIQQFYTGAVAPHEPRAGVTA